MPELLPGLKGPISNTAMFGNWVNTANAYPASGRNVVMSGGFGPSPAPVASGVPAVTNAMSSLTGAIPGFGGLTNQATQYLQNAMAGVLSPAEQAAIQQGRAQQAVVSGMPGSSRLQGTLGGNATLRDLGIATGERQRQGLGDFLSMLGTYAGNVFPTANASLESGTRRDIANLEAQLARERMAGEESRFGRQLSFDYSKLASDDAYRQGQLGIQGGELQLNRDKLMEDARQFESKMDLEDRRLAQSLGLNTQELALKLAELNARNAYDQGRLDLERGQQGFNQFSSLFNLAGSTGMNQNNLNSLLGMLGGTSAGKLPKQYRVTGPRLFNP